MKTLLPQRNFDHEPTHYLVQLKIFLLTARTRVVATDAGLADSETPQAPYATL